MLRLFCCLLSCHFLCFFVLLTVSPTSEDMMTLSPDDRQWTYWALYFLIWENQARSLILHFSRKNDSEFRVKFLFCCLLTKLMFLFVLFCSLDWVAYSRGYDDPFPRWSTVNILSAIISHLRKPSQNSDPPIVPWKNNFSGCFVDLLFSVTFVHKVCCHCLLFWSNYVFLVAIFKCDCRLSFALKTDYQWMN